MGRITVRIIAPDNDAGLSVDARLLMRILDGPEIRPVWWNVWAPPAHLRAMRKLGVLPFIPATAHINLFLERYHDEYLPLARRNVFIPNPEWFPLSRKPECLGIDEVLCKSVTTCDQLARHRTGVRYVGFSGEDRWGGAPAAAAPLSALHIAGRSEWKGTKAVLEVWRRNPQWPTLTVVQRPARPDVVIDTAPSANIRFVTGRIPQAELVRLQQTTPLLVLPSEVEGFGQTLIEGMSAGAIVVTTDGAPMNEIVSTGRGVLAAAQHFEPMRLGTRFLVDTSALERSINDVLSWTNEARVQTGLAARRWYVENHQEFSVKLRATLLSIAHGRTAAVI